MKKNLFALFLILAAAASAFGQGRTVVSGTVTDSNTLPYSGASLTASLVTPVGTVGAYLNGVQINGNAGPFQLDATGSFLMQLPDNTAIQCANATGQLVACAPQTQWAFAVTLSPGVGLPLGTGPQTCNATLTISGASQSVTSSFSACPALTKLANGTAGGGGGGSGTPSTQAGGSCLATAVLPGQYCAGPVPLASGAAPSFETAFANTSSTATTTYTINGAPLVNNSVGMLIVSNSAGASITAPDGTWTLFDDQHATLIWEIFQKTLPTNATLALTNSMGSSASYNAFLGFFGGSITSTPHTATSSTLTCPAPNDNCATLTVGPVSSANILLLVGRFTGTNVAQTAQVSDSAGNTWQKIYATSVPSNSLGVWVAQTPTASTPVITVDGKTAATIIGGCCKVYEIAGPTGYYSGSTGPTSFRYPNVADFFSLGIFPTQTFTDSQTAQAANFGPRTIVTAPQTGWYRAGCYIVETQAATTSATMPGCTVTYTDFDSNQAQPGISLTNNVAVNAVGQNSFLSPGTTVVGLGVFYAKVGTTITWSTVGYASTGATPMQYAARMRLEFLGP